MKKNVWEVVEGTAVMVVKVSEDVVIDVTTVDGVNYHIYVDTYGIRTKVEKGDAKVLVEKLGIDTDEVVKMIDKYWEE